MRPVGGWKLACAAALVVLLAASTLPLQLRALAVARARQHDASTALAVSQRDQRELHEQLIRSQAFLDRDRWHLALQTAEGVAIERRTTTHIDSRQVEEVLMENTQQALDDSSDSLESTRAVLGIQEHAMAPLRRCLRGVRDANESLAGGDAGAAAAALDGVRPACLRVRSGSTAPAFPYDFPDPHVTHSAGRWWGFATNSNAGAVQLISSADLDDWRFEGNALAAVPAWAVPGATWAPAVVRHGDRWLLFYTVRERASGLQCISVSTSVSIAGPFVDTSNEPLVCEREEGGSIDPDPVFDRDGVLHLLWKTELDTIGGRSELRGAALGDDGTTLDTTPVVLLRAASVWERRTIEGPAMVVGDGYHLLYSGGSWNGGGYAVGAARCETVLGPCTRQSDQPVLRSFADVRGPGGASVFRTGYGHGVAYHSWHGDDVGYPATRYLHLGRVRVVDGVVVLEG